jgi:putative copper export protein
MLALLVLLHLLGASVWVGGHLVLAVRILPRALRARDPEPVRSFEEAFEPVGIPALLVQAVTGVLLARLFSPRVADWFDLGNPVALHIAVKLGLLALTLALAAHARLRIIPRLDARRLPALAAHIVAVTVVSIGFVVVGVSFRTGGWLLS